MFDVYLRAYKDTRLAKQLTKQIIDNMLSRLHIGGRAFAERCVMRFLNLIDGLNSISRRFSLCELLVFCVLIVKCFLNVFVKVFFSRYFVRWKIND